jgi:hypothetical protein
VRSSVRGRGNTRELEAIERVIKELSREAVDDLIGQLRRKKAKAEIDHVKKFREAMIAVEKRLHDEEVPNPKVARAARTLGGEHSMNKNEQKDPVDQRHCMVCDRWVPIVRNGEPNTCSNPDCPYRESAQSGDEG